MTSREKLLKLIRSISDLEPVIELNKGDSSLTIVRDMRSGVYYLTLLDCDTETSKLLINAVVSSYPDIIPEEITFDNIYDIEALTSANSLEQLFGKMLFISRGCEQ